REAREKARRNHCSLVHTMVSLPHLRQRAEQTRRRFAPEARLVMEVFTKRLTLRHVASLRGTPGTRCSHMHPRKDASMHRLGKSLVLFLAVMACACCSFGALAGPRPNILLILADDMGYSDSSPYGGEIFTPNIATLAHQ